MLVLKNINKKFGDRRVLKNLNMEIKGGLNFIVGPSGCGKSTLLKIISGMDNEYDGEVLYREKDIKRFNTNELNSYYYNSVGFIWQNFQLIDYLSVEDNIKVVLELEKITSKERNERVEKILKRLSIENLAKKSVSTLSGGQKQRVAIARALVKDPDIIIADEPTGALDRKTSNLIMGILEKISKEKTVIVVTHDKSLVSDESNCFLLKDGMISQIANGNKFIQSKEKQKNKKPKLSLARASVQGLKNFKGLAMKFTLTALVLMLSSYFLLLNISGTVVNEQQDILNQLIEERGNTLRDIDLVTSAISGSGTQSQDANQNDGNKQSFEIKQDVSKVFEKLKNDPRVEFIVPLTTIDNMTVKIDGKEHKVEQSGTTVVVEDLIAGRMPNFNGREIAVSNLFVKKLNLKPEDVIGKVVSINGSGFDWSSGSPKELSTSIDNLTIVGVIDSKFTIDSPFGNTEKFEDELEDSFVYSLDLTKEIKKQLKSNEENISFKVRVKEIKDVMPIVTELEKEGLTPLGMFETVKDILKISDVTKGQAGSITIIIAIIAIVVTIAITIINSYLRKSEFAILKINGYSKASLMNLNIMEYILISIASAIIFIITLPIINNISKSVLEISVSGSNTMILGVGIVLVLGIFMGIISAMITANTKVTNNLMTGDR